MKKIVLGLVVACAMFTQVSAQTYKNSVSVLGGTSNLWLTNSAIESGQRPVYSHGNHRSGINRLRRIYNLP
jgi:hypothetical protein